MTEATQPTSTQTMGFQAEVKQLLHLMIHSLYSNKEIFLRELVSNASDACDKLRFEALDTPALYETDSELRIRVDFDKDARTITISDNGIGMSKDDAIAHLGTIARSGTREFFSQLTGDKQKDAQLIGQFGVGFYSSFIVADKVTVYSRRAGLPASEGIEWTSDGQGEFSVSSYEKAGRGTDIILHLRAEEDEFLTDWKLRDILRRYSDHISLPVQMPKQEWDKDSSEMKRTGDWEAVNQASALWTRSKSDITEEQYKEFYKHVSHDFDDPLAWTHNRVEGRSEYTQLLYIPKRAPFDMWDRDAKRGVKLYVKRVFIMDDAEQLLPSYLRFCAWRDRLRRSAPERFRVKYFKKAGMFGRFERDRLSVFWGCLKTLQRTAKRTTRFSGARLGRFSKKVLVRIPATRSASVSYCVLRRPIMTPTPKTCP